MPDFFLNKYFHFIFSSKHQHKIRKIGTFDFNGRQKIPRAFHAKIPVGLNMCVSSMKVSRGHGPHKWSNKLQCYVSIASNRILHDPRVTPMIV